MARYHLNSKTGEPGACRAKIRCPFGDLTTDHYGSKKEARQAYENKQIVSMKQVYPVYEVWNENIPKVLNDAIEYERLRQHTDEARREYLLEGWRHARMLSDLGEDLLEDDLLHIAGLVEPDNGGRLRITPVTFANGGYASPPAVVPAGVAQLLRFWPAKTDPIEDKRYWLKEFLVTHPFEDGNGRTAWVLQQWLMNSWDNPQKLWDFNF